MRIALTAGIVLALGAGGCDRGRDRQRQASEGPVTATTAQPAGGQAGVTPMAQRVSVLGLLNKLNGIVRDIPLRPGQSVRVRDVIVRLRACETTAPWESEVLTGAFVQVDVERTDGRWQRVFSGWLYKESPSLNVVEHPVYDVWPKSCEMTYPTGPAAPAPVTSSNASSAKKSGGATAAEPAPPPVDVAPSTPPPSAAANNAT